MNFNLEKLKEISRQRTDKERTGAEYRDENRDWLAVSEKLALKIRHALREAKISQAELAKRMGVTPAQVTKILSGKENLGLKTICKIESALGQNLLNVSLEDATLQDCVAQHTTVQVITIPVFVKSDAVASTSCNANEYASLMSNYNLY